MKPVKFATQIDDKVLKELKKYTKEQGRSISHVVSEAVSEYLKKVNIKSAFRNAMDEVLEDNKELLSRLAK